MLRSIIGSVLAGSLILMPGMVLADTPQTPVPYQIHPKTSYHDAQNQIQPQSGKPADSKNSSGEFVEYFSVPVPGGQPVYAAPPTLAPAPMAPYAAMPSPPQPYNVYWQMANSPYPFGIENFDGDYYGGYYPYGYGYGFGFGNGFYGRGFGRGRGFNGQFFDGTFYPNGFQTLTPNAFGITTPTAPGFVQGSGHEGGHEGGGHR